VYNDVKEGVLMKNVIMLICLICFFAASIIQEPIRDTADLISGASTQTFQTEIDVIAGASEGVSQSDYS
jgi:hypothetical protein